MLKHLIVFILCFSLIACNKKETQPSEYVKGDLIVGMKGDLPVDSFFAFVNKHGFYIQQVNLFTYGFPHPENQFDSLAAYLNTKSYVDTGSWKVKIAYHHVWEQPVYRPTFFDMDVTDQTDWLQTVKELGIVQLEDSFASALLRVPEGSELYWEKQLSNHPMLRWAEVNGIIQLELH